MGAKPGPSAPAPLLTAAPGGSPSGFWKGALPGSRELEVGEDPQQPHQRPGEASAGASWRPRDVS